MAVVKVDVGIRRSFHSYGHQWFYYIELNLQHAFVVFVLVVNGQTVVAAHLQAALLVGNGKLVVGVEHRGVDAVDIVLDGIAVEALQPFALKQVVRGCPVGLAVFQPVDEAVVVVRQLVEADQHPVAASQFHDGTIHPVAVDDACQRTDTVNIDTVAGMSIACQQL